MLIAAIENEVDIVHLLEEVCALEGWDLMACLRGEGALEQLNQSRPDVIIFEPWLGSLERGWELLEALKAEPATSTIPIILWTNWMHRLEEKEAQLAAWGIPILPKPCDLDDLSETIAAVLGPPGRDDVRSIKLG